MHAAARTVVKAYAVILWIVALMSLILSFGLFTEGTPGSDIALQAYFYILLAVFFAYVAIGLWKFKHWGKVCALILSIICILTGVRILQDPIVIVYVLIGLYGLWFFTFVPVVKELFATPAAAPEPAKPAAATPKPVEKPAAPAIVTIPVETEKPAAKPAPKKAVKKAAKAVKKKK